MIRHSSSARSNVVPLSVDKPVARATANIEWSVYAVCLLPGGVRSTVVRGWLCISGTIVPAALQIHITHVVSQCPFVHSLVLSPSLSSLSSIYPFVRTREYLTVHRETARGTSLYRPTRSICKPPRNESVNPVTSFAAILVLRRLDARAIFRQILRAGLVSNANPRSRALLGDRANANSYARKHRRDYLRSIPVVFHAKASVPVPFVSPKMSE